MVVACNLSALNAQRQFNLVGKSKKKSTEKLSSGYRINRAADDAAGLAISEKMRRQIRGLTQGAANLQDGISLCQIADGALEEVSDMLHRITELSVKASNGVNAQLERDAIQSEIGEIVEEIDRITNTTTFNDKQIFALDDYWDRIYRDKIQDSIEVNIGQIPGGVYRLDANNDGLTFAGTHLAWNSITDTSGNSLNADNLKEGTYYINKSGIRYQFEVPKGAKLYNVISAINNTEIVVKERTISDTTSIAVSNSGDVENFLSKSSHTLVANNDGVKLDNYNLITWESLGVDKDNYTCTPLSMKFSDAGVTLGISPSNVKTFDELKELLNKTKVKVNVPAADSSYTVNASYSRTTAGGVQINLTGYTMKKLDSLYSSFGISKYDLYKNNSSSKVMNVSYKFVGSNWNDLAIEMTANGITKRLEMTDADKAAFAANGNYSLDFYLDKNDTNSYKVTVNAIDNNVTPYNADGLARQILSSGALPNGGINGNTMSVSREKIKKSDIIDIDLDASEIPAKKSPIWIHYGSEADQGTNLVIGEMNASVLGVRMIDVSTEYGATKALGTTKAALAKVSKLRSDIGAYQNRLEHSYNINMNIVENTQAAETRIRDTDMSDEMIKASLQNVLSQAGIAMMAQANQMNQSVLSLLQ